MNRNTKNLFRVLALGALSGGFLTSYIAPKAIGWYFDPPAGFGVSCKEPIEWALSKLQTAQLWGLLIGGALGLLIFFAFSRSRNGALPPNNNNY